MEREIRWWMWWNDGRLFNFQRTIKNTCCWMFWLLCAKTHIIHLCTHFSSLALSTHTTIAALTQQPMRCDFDDIRFIFNSGSIHQFKSNQRPVIAVTTPTCLFSIPPMPFFRIYILLPTEDYTIWGISEAISQEKQCLTCILKYITKPYRLKMYKLLMYNNKV